jgi:hypothetical protein
VQALQAAALLLVCVLLVHAEGHEKRTVAVCTIGSLVFVLPRPALLEDEDAYGVRHVHRGVHRP